MLALQESSPKWFQVDVQVHLRTECIVREWVVYISIPFKDDLSTQRSAIMWIWHDNPSISCRLTTVTPANNSSFLRVERTASSLNDEHSFSEKLRLFVAISSVSVIRSSPSEPPRTQEGSSVRQLDVPDQRRKELLSLSGAYQADSKQLEQWLSERSLVLHSGARDRADMRLWSSLWDC